MIHMQQVYQVDCNSSISIKRIYPLADWRKDKADIEQQYTL
jgi:hypothetical protein